MDFMSNDRLISFHRNKHDYIPSPENTFQFAYGDRRYVKMASELMFAHEILQLKTLEEINEDLYLKYLSNSHRGDFINLALLSSELLEVLVKHLSNKHNKIRQLSASAMVLISGNMMGREHIMKGCYVQDLMRLFDDQVEDIRFSAYQSLLQLAEFQEGVDHILSFQVLNPLVDKLIEENVEGILLEVLKLIIRGLAGEQGQIEILRTMAIKRLTSLLDRENSNIRRLACENLCAISFSEKGKLEVIKQGCVSPLLKLLDDADETVIEQATMALASLAQRNEGKFEIMDHNKLPKILTLLDHKNEQIVLNTVQLVASMAEHPKGREMCKNSLVTLKRIADELGYISTYAQQAIEVILWIP